MGLSIIFAPISNCIYTGFTPTNCELGYPKAVKVLAQRRDTGASSTCVVEYTRILLSESFFLSCYVLYIAVGKTVF